MRQDNLKTSKMTPEKFLNFLKGDEIGMENREATTILQFLKKLARIVVKKYIEK